MDHGNRLNMTLAPAGYRHRLAESKLQLMLETFGAVSIEGPKFCGKTWLSKYVANSSIDLNNAEGNYANRTMANLDVRTAFAGAPPHLIDEWQEVPAIWDAAKEAVDSSAENGRFILTGSSTPHLKGNVHSGAGRIGRMSLRTMSLCESGESDGSVSLASLFRGEPFQPEKQPAELDQLIHLVIRGGWPRNLALDDVHALEANKAYLKTIREDAVRLDGKMRNDRKIGSLLKSLGRNESAMAAVSTLVSDIAEYQGEQVSDKSVVHYLDVLDRLFITCDQPSFDPNPRSATRVGKSPKRHLTDPSLAVAAMELDAERLKQDLRTFGFLFEALCERDLDVYAQAGGGTLSHYRDYSGREIDAVVEMPGGKWGAFEIKLGADQIDSAAAGLLKMRDSLEQAGCERLPSVLGVICGLSQAAYWRRDGVAVVPITALGP